MTFYLLSNKSNNIQGLNLNNNNNKINNNNNKIKTFLKRCYI